MRHVLIVGEDQLKLRIDIEEQYFEIFSIDFVEPLKFPYDDPYDIIKIVEQYTILSQEDIQSIIGVCNYD